MAQTGADLLIKPWPKDKRVEGSGDFYITNNGSTRTSDDFQLTFYNTEGRARLFPGERADPRFGYSYTQINTSGDPALPSQLVDTSVGLGIGLADMSGWLAGVTFGVGYAGAGAFDDGNAWYYKADLLVGKQLDERTKFGVVLDYDGNRTFMPDVPLPGFVYEKRISDQLLLGFGFPYTSVEYKPTEKLTLSGRFEFPDDIQARVEYEVVNTLSIFGETGSYQAAFHWDELPVGSDRLLYDSTRVELGVIWSPFDSAKLIVAGGYVWGQEFNVGFDTRDQDRVVKPSDEPYLRAGFEVKF